MLYLAMTYVPLERLFATLRRVDLEGRKEVALRGFFVCISACAGAAVKRLGRGRSRRRISGDTLLRVCYRVEGGER